MSGTDFVNGLLCLIEALLLPPIAVLLVQVLPALLPRRECLVPAGPRLSPAGHWQPLFLSTPNVNFVISSRGNADFRDSVFWSDLIVPDGITLRPSDLVSP